jgi:hypothetical protein
MAKRMSKKERWQKTTEIWWFTGYHQIREAIENIIDVVDDEDMDDDWKQELAQGDVMPRISISSRPRAFS